MVADALPVTRSDEMIDDDEDILGPTRTCTTCAEVWPDDDVFFVDASHPSCIACETERESRRRRSVAQAAKRYRRRVAEQQVSA